jgi:hypothetical protein
MEHGVDSAHGAGHWGAVCMLELLVVHGIVCMEQSAVLAEYSASTVSSVHRTEHGALACLVQERRAHNGLDGAETERVHGAIE